MMLNRMLRVKLQRKTIMAELLAVYRRKQYKTHAKAWGCFYLYIVQFFNLLISLYTTVASETKGDLWEKNTIPLQGAFISSKTVFS